MVPNRSRRSGRLQVGLAMADQQFLELGQKPHARLANDGPARCWPHNIITIGRCVGERIMTPDLGAYAATKDVVKIFNPTIVERVGKLDPSRE